MTNSEAMKKLTAEIRNDLGKPIDGFTFDKCDPVTASSFEQTITWGGKRLGELESKEVRVLFRLEDAELFTFDFTPTSAPKTAAK